MSIAVHLPEALAARLVVESARRGISVEELTAELLRERLAAPGLDDSALEMFIGSGSSGQGQPFDIHRTRTELAARTNSAETS